MSGEVSSSRLALLGGEPVMRQAPSFRWPPVTEDDVAAVSSLVRRGELSYYGREGEVETLENSFRELLGVPHALATSSGTAALHSAFFALGLPPGSEVLAPTYTFLATVMPLFTTNLVPRLVDAEPDTGNIDPAALEAAITPASRAVIVTHMWGHPCDMERIRDIAGRHDLLLVEDCSHAHGASCHGQPVGTFGDVAVFSLQGKKLVAAGQGGILVTRNRAIYERATLLGHFKVRAWQEVESEEYRRFAGTGFGLNYRMHPLAAAIANTQLAHLQEYIAARHHNFAWFSDELRRRQIPGISPPVWRDYADQVVYYSYKPLYHPEQLGHLPVDLYVEALAAEGVAVEKSETVPLHCEPIFQEPGNMVCYGGPELSPDGTPRPLYRTGDFPNSEQYAERALAIPAFTEPVREYLAGCLEACEKVATHHRDLLATLPLQQAV